MRFLHSMIRVRDLDAALRFFVELLGLREVRRTEHAERREPHHHHRAEQHTEMGSSVFLQQKQPHQHH